MSDSTWPYGLQHARLPCPLLSLRVWSNLCPLCQLCHPTISSSVALLLLLHQGLFQCVGSSHQVAKVLELQHQSFQWVFSIPLGWTGWIALLSKGLSRVFSSTTVQKHQFFSVQSSLWSNFLIRTWLKKPWLWLYRPLSAKRCLCLSNTLSRLVMAFVPWSKHLLISRLQSPVHSGFGVGFLLNQEASWRKKKKNKWRNILNRWGF